MKKLTAKQEAFAQAVADGKEQSAAYRIAYDCPRSTPTTCAKEASRIAAFPHVAARIAELKGKVQTARALSRDRKREILNEVVEGVRNLTAEQIKCLEIDNRMAGDNEPDEVVVAGASEWLKKFRNRPAVMQPQPNAKA